MMVAKALLAVAIMMAAPAAASGYDATLLFTFQDGRIAESSGLAVSSYGDAVLYTHNDSGDSARFFAVDHTGCTVATYNLPGVMAVDWEDMSAGPGPALWFGDIGDNNAQRPSIAVYRVAEPSRVEGDGCDHGAEHDLEWEAFTLRYEDFAQDAETLFVHPATGQLFVVTKSFLGRSNVYAAPVPLQPDSTLTRVASFTFTITGTHGNPFLGPAAQLLATGGDISPNGDRLAIRTYTDVWEWSLGPAGVAAAIATAPTRTTLPETQQGEAMAYINTRKLVCSSEVGSGPPPAPVHLLRAAP